MADQALKLKVDKDTYNNTLEQLRTQLGKLRDCRDRLSNQINELDHDDILGGSIVQSTKDTAKLSLEKVEAAIRNVEAYENAIQKQLNGTVVEERNLENKLSNINISDLFD